MFSKMVLLFLSVFAISGCFSQQDVGHQEPFSWKDECKYSLKDGPNAKCAFDPFEVYENAPESSICISKYESNGLVVSFSYDFAKEEVWFEFNAEQAPISGIVHSPTTDELAYFLDEDVEGAIILPWNEMSRDVNIAIYWDFMYYGDAELGPMAGKQEFLSFEGDLYTVTKWNMEERTIFVGHEEIGFLSPIGIESWIDYSGPWPVVNSMKTFIKSEEIPTLLPESCP